jgi:hypothetical protein
LGLLQARRGRVLVVRVALGVFALGDVGDLLEGNAGLLAQDPPAPTGESADATEVFFVLVLELFRVPHVGAVDHEGVRGSGYVLLVATAPATVSGAPGIVVVEDDVQGGTVFDDLLEARIELLNRVHATVGSLDRRARTPAAYGRGRCAGLYAHLPVNQW